MQLISSGKNYSLKDTAVLEFRLKSPEIQGYLRENLDILETFEYEISGSLSATELSNALEEDLPTSGNTTGKLLSLSIW